MGIIPFRQIHLDFHTSELIPKIGFSFSKERFQENLLLGHVNSVTLFAKCHHGWAYHNTTVNTMHPNLSFDLLSLQLAACKEIGVRTRIYISAGIDEKEALKNPQWCLRNRNESTVWSNDFCSPGYHLLCFGTPYLDLLAKQVEEIVRLFDTDGLFLDITDTHNCWCRWCREGVIAEGEDHRDEAAVKRHGKRVFVRYLERMNSVVHSIKPQMQVFHNGGHLHRGERKLAMANTHYELESLPTGGWGYDHFPVSARYASTLGIDYLGMTGKFHTSWGEFGGFKHPNALRYEASLCLSLGAKCSIGDQLHPYGDLEPATYSLIGTAYSEVEKKEPWCDKTENIADIAVLSIEALNNKYNLALEQDVARASDFGANRMLQESKFLFDIIDADAEFDLYKVLVLPDLVPSIPQLNEKLQSFIKNGGKLFASGESCLDNEQKDFVFNFGVKWIEKNSFSPDYFRPTFKPGPLESTPFVMYSRGQKISCIDGAVLGGRENPFFNRECLAFSSHQHTPNSFESGGPGMVEGTDGIYFAWNIFSEYTQKGSLVLREIVRFGIERLCGLKTVTTNLPAQGIVTLRRQKDQSRYIVHLLYGSPVKRGGGIEIVEDLITQKNTTVSVRLEKKIKKVYLAPQNTELTYSGEKGEISFVVPDFECHQMVVLDVDE